ncbi:hypothetical protein N7490_006672 [Penicillium lividum]|nr:hypothetical protein N7490_006672 [Penicillium lividum]
MLGQRQDDRSCFQHFALIWIDREGRLHHKTSPSISNSIKTILSPQVTREFLKAVAESKEGGFPVRLPASSLTPTVPGLGASIECRRGLWTEEHSLASQTATIHVNEKGLLRQYFAKVFQNLQQTNCRSIAKVWVKIVEPRKQILFPYNGRKVVAGKTIQFSPEETQPPWWPTGVSHREPDHLLKAERIALLVHILCELRTSHRITAQKLKDAGQHIRQSISPMERLQLLDELFRVKEEEEKYLDRVTDGTTTISISRANLPDSMVFTRSKSPQYTKRPRVAQMCEHEPQIQNTSICLQPAQAVIPLNVHVDPCGIMDFPHRQGLLMEPNSVPSPVSLEGPKRGFSSVEDARVPTASSSADNWSSSLIASDPSSVDAYENFPQYVGYLGTKFTWDDLYNQ